MHGNTARIAASGLLVVALLGLVLSAPAAEHVAVGNPRHHHGRNFDWGDYFSWGWGNERCRNKNQNRRRTSTTARTTTTAAAVTTTPPTLPPPTTTVTTTVATPTTSNALGTPTTSNAVGR